MNLQELANRIDQVGLTHRKSEILDLALPVIALHTKRVEDESMLALGASKIGGLPDLPPTLKWPIWENRVFEFVAQIALPDIAPFDTDNLLPHTGILYLFYDSDQWTWGQPYDNHKCSVLYYEDDPAQLVRQSKPVGLETVYSACSVTVIRKQTLPAFRSLLRRAFLDMLNDSDNDEAQFYWDLLDWLYNTGGPYQNTYLFGHPELAQNDVFSEAYWAKHNPPTGRFLRELSYQDVQDWVLLFQMDSDQEANMMWGDAGKLYYCIPRSALQERKFGESAVLLQCY